MARGTLTTVVVVGGLLLVAGGMYGCPVRDSCEGDDDCFKRQVCRNGECVVRRRDSGTPAEDTGAPAEDTAEPSDGMSMDGGDGATCGRVGATQSCYTADDQSTVGTGPCKWGTQRCREDGSWGPCTGEQTPVEEACNDEDDDCDGSVDEGIETYFDGDEDGFGAGPPREECKDPSLDQWTDRDGDCEPDDPEVFPGRNERCRFRNTDYDCDGEPGCGDEECTEGTVCEPACGCDEKTQQKTCTGGMCNCSQSKQTGMCD